MLAPLDIWRFGSLVWSDGTHEVRSPIAVNAQLLTATPAIEGTGADGTASIDVSFGYNGDYTAGAHGLLEPDLYGPIPVADDPDNSFDHDLRGGRGDRRAFGTEAAGTMYAQWSLFDEYNDGDHDLDLYLFYCPSDLNLPCTFEDTSGNPTATETVSAKFPKDDGTEDDGYYLVIHGHQTQAGQDANVVLFTWASPGAAADEGNMTVTPPASATLGQTETVEVSWAGLSTGPGSKQVGAISHNDANGPLDATSIEITNDEGAGFCDLVEC